MGSLLQPHQNTAKSRSGGITRKDSTPKHQIESNITQGIPNITQGISNTLTMESRKRNYKTLKKSYKYNKLLCRPTGSVKSIDIIVDCIIINVMWLNRNVTKFALHYTEIDVFQ